VVGQQQKNDIIRHQIKDGFDITGPVAAIQVATS